MELYDGIMTTRAIRRFTDEPVSDDEVMACLRAAQQAPSGGNIQPWQFVVVTDASAKASVADIYRRAYDRYEPVMIAATPPARTPDGQRSWERSVAASRYLAEHLADAPVVIVVLMPDISMTLSDDDGPLDVGTPYASVYPAVQNLLLAARSMGIGGTLTTVHRILQDEVRAALSIPERFQTVAMIPLGRPKGSFGVAPRRPVESVTHWQGFGQRRNSD